MFNQNCMDKINLLGHLLNNKLRNKSLDWKIIVMRLKNSCN